MHIKKISVRNFKSFSKRIDIPFYEGFTVISGPNGSGKSNIIDSILFCLGLSHSSKLRADRLTDLVFSGNGNIDDAEVSIIFDNQDGTVSSDPEIVITRKIRMTEKGYYSYYYINGKSASLSDIRRLLSQAGVYSDSYNVIMQGDVTRITETTPFQRRKIIDDIAGISEFEEKKEKALEELEKVRENMDTIETILHEVSIRLEQLEKDKDEALRYRSLVDKKDLNKKYLLAHRYRNLLSKKEKLKSEIDNLEKKKDSDSSRIVELGNEIQELNSQAEELSARISERSDESLQKIQNKIVEGNSEMESIKRAEDFYKNELSKHKDERNNILLSISKLKEELGAIDEEMDHLLSQKISVQEVVNETEEKVESTRAKLQEVDEKFKKMRDDLLSLKEEMDQLKERKSGLVREQDTKLETIRRIDMETEELDKEKQKLEKAISDMQKEKEGKEKEFEKAEKQLEKKIKERNDIDSELFSQRDQLSGIEEELRSKEVELEKVKGKIAALKPFSRPVEMILEAKKKKALPGVYGTVSQLGEVNEKYVQALETAAGNALQFVVVENEDDAIRAINYLKQIKGGRATFLPLNKIKRDVKLNSLPKKDGVVDYAINLVNFEKKFKPVFNFVYRDTLVVDNIQIAKKLMDGRRIVTLEGDLIEKSGSMSGGYTEKKRGMLLSSELIEKEKSINEEITILNSKKAGILGNIRSNEQARKSVQEEVDNQDQVVNNIKNELSLLNSRIDDSSNRVTEIEDKLRQKTEERNNKYSEISEIENKVKELDSQIKEKSQKISKLEKSLKGSEVPQLSSQLEKLKDELSRNKESLISIEKKLENTEFRKEQLEKSKEEKEAEIATIDEEMDDLNSKIDYGRKRVEELNEEIQNLRVEEERLGKEVKGLREERDRILEQISKKEQEKQNANYDIVTINEKISARKESLAEVEKDMQDVGEIDIDVDSIPSYEQVTSQLEEIENELIQFGEVNLKAIQEYEEVNRRKNELVERNQTLEKERNDILERIEKYERMKKESFFNAFNAVNKNFSEIINTLTGGEGELFLDGEDPFESGMYIKVKFSNKTYQRLDSMSGGEKSLVALALIFAIQEYKPVPFYALDEVDMFLDGINVNRVAKMLKERSRNAQFVVVSLRKPMLEQADSIIGVTLGRDNTSQVTGIKVKA
ncbi:MAG: chromosome segregation protein SMC [Halobacteriota archaeon]